MFQCDGMLYCLKATNWHASRNVLNRHQSMMNGVPTHNSMMPIPTSSTHEPKASTFNLLGSLDLRPSIDNGEWMVTKVKMLHITDLKTWQWWHLILLPHLKFIMFSW
jgi:hypothetical protein